MFSDKKGVDRFTLATCQLFQHCSMLPYLFLCIRYWSYSTHAPSTDFCTLSIIFRVTAFVSNCLLTSDPWDQRQLGVRHHHLCETVPGQTTQKHKPLLQAFCFCSQSRFGFLCVGCRFWSGFSNRVKPNLLSKGIEMKCFVGFDSVSGLCFWTNLSSFPT